MERTRTLRSIDGKLEKPKLIVSKTKNIRKSALVELENLMRKREEILVILNDNSIKKQAKYRELKSQEVHT